MSIASAMTLLEADAYTHPDSIGANGLWGYPEGLAAEWMTALHNQPPAGFTTWPAAECEAVITGYFARLFGGQPRIALTPDATTAYSCAIAAATRPGNEIIFTEFSYDGWPGLAADTGRIPVYAARDADGRPSLTAIRDAVTSRTAAIVIVSPDNPAGTICPAATLRGLLDLCREPGITLITDHVLADINPERRTIPLLPRAAAGHSGSWITIGDTGKVAGPHGSPNSGA